MRRGVNSKGYQMSSEFPTLKILLHFFQNLRPSHLALMSIFRGLRDCCKEI